jgi:DUF971 family protein
VAVVPIESVGDYAIIVFDNGCNTGFYTWDYLHKLAN